MVDQRFNQRLGVSRQRIAVAYQDETLAHASGIGQLNQRNAHAGLVAPGGGFRNDADVGTAVEHAARNLGIRFFLQVDIDVRIAIEKAGQYFGQKSVTAVVLANTRKCRRKPPPYSCRSAHSGSV